MSSPQDTPSGAGHQAGSASPTSSSNAIYHLAREWASELVGDDGDENGDEDYSPPSDRSDGIESFDEDEGEDDADDFLGTYLSTSELEAAPEAKLTGY